MLIFITSSNLPCLENESQTCLACLMGEKNSKISAIHICKSVKWRCAVVYVLQQSWGTKFRLKEHEIEIIMEFGGVEFVEHH